MYLIIYISQQRIAISNELVEIKKEIPIIFKIRYVPERNSQ